MRGANIHRQPFPMEKKVVIANDAFYGRGEMPSSRELWLLPNALARGSGYLRRRGQVPGCTGQMRKSASWEVLSLVDVKLLQVLPAPGSTAGGCEQMM